jgi:hypothetical protein
MDRTTYRTMGISDLGDNADAADLAKFQALCASAALSRPEMDEAAITSAVWNDGDWLAGARKLGVEC